jgi:hypothetical protein
MSGWYLYLSQGNYCPRQSPYGLSVSFILKILEKLINRYIRGGVLVEKPLHRYQFTYRVGVSTETALFQVVHRVEKSLKHKHMALGAFLDIEGAFDNTSFNAMVGAARGRGLEETCCKWIKSMLFLLAVAWLPGLQDAHREKLCLLSSGILLSTSYWPV